MWDNVSYQGSVTYFPPTRAISAYLQLWRNQDIMPEKGHNACMTWQLNDMYNCRYYQLTRIILVLATLWLKHQLLAVDLIKLNRRSQLTDKGRLQGTGASPQHTYFIWDKYSENAKACKPLVSMYINEFRWCQKLIVYAFS